MEHETQGHKKENLLPFSIFVSALILAGAWVYKKQPENIAVQKTNATAVSEQKESSALEEAVLPRNGVVLPAVWGDLGAKLTSVGAINRDKFLSLYSGTDRELARRFLDEKEDAPLAITSSNAGILLNLFWALGLASKNPILDSGEMTDPRYGGAQNFASTAGWTIAQGNPMDPVRGREGSQRPSASNGMEHYSRHLFFTLTPEQQKLVDKVSRGIYRPCCTNSTHFPDCNHGMAMLGLLELMASQGASEQDMWKAALAVNSYWFPDTYLTIATYMKNKGVEWENVNSQEMLGANYSSAQGYARIVAQVTQPQQQRSESGCGVSTGETVAPQRQQGGCGI